MRTETFELLKPIVDSINKLFTGTSIVDNANGTYTILTTDTMWISAGFTITIDSIDYKVVSFVLNTSITIKGNTPPTLLKFDIYEPKFVHGTIIATNEELKKQILGSDKFPMIYLHEITRENYNNEPDAAIDKTSDCGLYFLVSADFESWLTEDHYKNAIAPMRSLLFAFKDALNERSDLIGEFNSFDTYDHAKFGVYIADKGHTKRIFDDNLSGSELRISIPFRKTSFC